MNPRNQRGNRSESNFSRRGRDESASQWTAYGRTDSDRNDRGSYRVDQSDWTGSDYDTARDSRSRDSGYRSSSEFRENQDRYGSSMRGDERQHEMNRYPHSYDEYDSRRDMENRRFGASEGNGYLRDHSHEDYSESRELYRPSFEGSSSSYSPRSSRMASSFSGRGPKGYKRSDERIKEEVCDLLTRDQFIDAEDIEVEVRDGEVTLSGFVPDRRMKHMAEDCVERALGVKDVTNNIRLKRDMSSSSDTGSQSLTGDRTSTSKKSASGSTSSITTPNH